MRARDLHPRRAASAFARAARAMLDHRNPRDAAAISYFSLFALFPAMLVIIALVQDVLGWLEVRKAAVERIIALFPVSQGFLDTNLNLIRQPSSTLVLSCAVVVMWTATWVFSFLENALNRAWNVQRRRTFWQSRMRSIAVICLGGTILLLSASLTSIAGAAHWRTLERIPAYASDQIIHWLTSAALIIAGTLLAIAVFSCIYKLIPDRRIPWIEALSGAVVAATLWECGSFIFVKLVPLFDYELVYGRMGAIIAILVWVYTSNLIMLFGAHFSSQLHCGSPAATASPPLAAESSESFMLRRKIHSFPRRPRS